ncbi:MAG: hypothetical protein QOJ62_3139 [Actinomycetota bacterium]|jgi:hypothetical protein|nr:hypothetical protein [Actinomycetota bacterium]
MVVDPARAEGDDRGAGFHHVPSRKDRFYLGVFSFVDSVVLGAVFIAVLRQYGLPLIGLMWVLVGVRISRVKVVANSHTIHVVNRYRTYSVDTSAVTRLQLRTLVIGNGPFAVAMRLQDEGLWPRLRGGAVVEATASYSESVNDSMKALGAFVDHAAAR